MKRAILFYLLMSFVAQHGCGQSKDAIDSFFQKERNISLDYFLFAPMELLKLCTDSTGRQKFINSIDRHVMKVKSNRPEEKEMMVLLTLICNQVKAMRLDNEQYINSRLFIEATLNPYLIDFKVSENFVRDRFSTDSDLTDCSACHSMYLFLVYDPLLYAKVRLTEKGFADKKSHFPLAYTLQNCDLPLRIRVRMKEGLLQILSEYQDSLLTKISKEISECSLDVSCN